MNIHLSDQFYLIYHLDYLSKSTQKHRTTLLSSFVSFTSHGEQDGLVVKTPASEGARFDPPAAPYCAAVIAVALIVTYKLMNFFLLLTTPSLA